MTVLVALSSLPVMCPPSRLLLLADAHRLPVVLQSLVTAEDGSQRSMQSIDVVWPRQRHVGGDEVQGVGVGSDREDSTKNGGMVDVLREGLEVPNHIGTRGGSDIRDLDGHTVNGACEIINLSSEHALPFCSSRRRGCLSQTASVSFRNESQEEQ